MFDQQNVYGVPNNQMYPGMAVNNGNTIKFNNPLTPEQIKRLQAKETQFSLGLTEEEQLRGICNHRNVEGTSDTLIFDPISCTARCSICGYEFRPVEPEVGPEIIKEDVSRIVDILQTIKLMYIDLPAEAAREYFQIIPLIEKIPQLFEFAGKNMAKHDAYNMQYNNRNMGAVAMLNNLQNLFGGMNSMAYQQQPQMNPAFNQVAGFPQAAYQQPQMNPYGFNGMAPMTPAYTPATPQGFAYTPAATPVAPVAPTVTAPAAPATADTNVTQTVNI